MKKIILFLLLAIQAAVYVNAQIYKSDICFYKDIDGKSSNVLAVKFYRGGTMHLIWFNKNLIKDDPNYCEKKFENPIGDCFKYNSEMSTSRDKEVYFYETKPLYQSQFTLTFYYEFSKDATFLIRWEKGSDIKFYYRRVDKSELLPKAANDDFLYE